MSTRVCDSTCIAMHGRMNGTSLHARKPSVGRWHWRRGACNHLEHFIGRSVLQKSLCADLRHLQAFASETRALAAGALDAASMLVCKHEPEAPQWAHHDSVTNRHGGAQTKCLVEGTPWSWRSSVQGQSRRRGRCPQRQQPGCPQPQARHWRGPQGARSSSAGLRSAGTSPPAGQRCGWSTAHGTVLQNKSCPEVSMVEHCMRAATDAN